MKKRNPDSQSTYIYDENGTEEVSEQIMNSYNSGVLDPSQMKVVGEGESDNVEE